MTTSSSQAQAGSQISILAYSSTGSVIYLIQSVQSVSRKVQRANEMNVSTMLPHLDIIPIARFLKNQKGSAPHTT